MLMLLLLSLAYSSEALPSLRQADDGGDDSLRWGCGLFDGGRVEGGRIIAFSGFYH